jgi:hypothetical protein
MGPGGPVPHRVWADPVRTLCGPERIPRQDLPHAFALPGVRCHLTLCAVT